VQNWQDVPASRFTLDANFDEGIPADYASLWNGRDAELLFPNGFRKGQVFEVRTAAGNGSAGLSDFSRLLFLTERCLFVGCCVQDNNPPFCFNVPNTSNRQVQVMLQTVDPHARICIKDVTVNTRATGGLDTCFSDRKTACFNAQTDTSRLQLQVYVPSSGGATTATAFWYRVRVSEGTWNINDGGEAARMDSARSSLEMWCAMQDQNVQLMQYPSDLRSSVLPAYVQRPSVQEAAASGAAGLSLFAAAAALLAAVVAQRMQ
jgi:hypothetical protein